MKQTWNSFLQTVFQFVRGLSASVSKKRYKDALVMTVGISIVTLVTLTAGDFEGVHGNAMVAFAETQETGGEEKTDLEETAVSAPDAEEEINEETDAKESEDAIEEREEETEGEEGEAPATDGAEPGAENGMPGTESELSGNAASEAEEPGKTSGADEADGANAANAAGVRTESEAPEAAVAEPAAEPEAEEAAITLSDRDYQVLLKIVQAEAGGCDEMGRILVANVILNRVESDEFPDTVHGVVYERHQFSPVSDGSLNRCKVTAETVSAVDRALSGEDYSDGALYFMNRKSSSRKNVRWFDNHLEYLFKHGNHEFFR